LDSFEHLFIGIDVGTTGVRALAVTETGDVVARATVEFDQPTIVSDGKIHEQMPQAWWLGVCQASETLMRHLRKRGTSSGALAALAVDGTSGTVVALDAAGEPVRPGVMYNDARAGVEADELNALAGDFCAKLGYQFKASFGLPKALWLQRNEPASFDRTVRLIHQADYIQGRLTGEFGVSDYSNALKTGYDLIDECWPAWIDNLPGIRERLPRVVAPGTAVGRVSARAARQTGLPAGLTVVTGASDGTAAFLASGATRSGDCNTTLGTTLVFKQVSNRLCKHPDGLVYCHKLPGGCWLPGAASNVGGEWIDTWFEGHDLSMLDRRAGSRLPSPCVAYPLVRSGERFPFLRPDASGFCVPDPGDPTDRFAANLQGVAFVERLSCEVLDAVTGHAGSGIFSTGGGSTSDVWMQCRADVTGRRYHRPSCPESAFGSAVLAASAEGSDVFETVRGMVRIAATFEPDPERTGRYDVLFLAFRSELTSRGYL
jgi:sugar (pentulose or hexulose) kinase